MSLPSKHRRFNNEHPDLSLIPDQGSIQVPPFTVHQLTAWLRVSTREAFTHTATHLEPSVRRQAPRVPAWLQPEVDQMSDSSLHRNLGSTLLGIDWPEYSAQIPVWVVHEPTSGGGQTGVSEPPPQPARSSDRPTPTTFTSRIVVGRCARCPQLRPLEGEESGASR